VAKYLKIVPPTLISAPSSSGARVTVCAPIHVPFVLPRSSSHQASSTRTKRQCSRDAESSSSEASAPASRPIVNSPRLGSRSNFAPMRAP